MHPSPELLRWLAVASQHLVIRGILLIGKNLLGFIFVVVGIVLLALPRQGLLTVIIGIMLLDFPGKFKLERWVISQKPAIRSINWLRQRSNCQPLEIPEDSEPSATQN